MSEPNMPKTSDGNVVAEEPLFSTPYGFIYENTATNSLSCLSQKMIDELVAEGNGNVEMPIGRNRINDVEYLMIPSKVNLSGSTAQMFDYIVQLFTEKVYRNATPKTIEENRTIDIDLKDVSEKFGLTMRATRDMVLRTVSSLDNIKIRRLDIPETKKGDIKIRSFRIFSEQIDVFDGKVIKNSHTQVVLHERLAELLPIAYLMRYPENLYKINTARYTNAFMFGRRLCLHYRINVNKGNGLEDHIGADVLLDLAYSIPKKEDIERKGELRRRIVRPFVRDMDVLVEKHILSEWFLVDKETNVRIKNPNVISPKKLKESFVYFHLLNYPKEKAVS